MQLVIRIINLIALVAAVAWCFSAPGWEPIVVALGLVATLIGSGYWPKRPDRREPDSRLYSEFIELLPSTGSIEFVRNNHFGAAFVFERLRPLFRFLDNWNDPEHRFHDRKIERKRQQLHSSVDTFLEKIAQHTFLELDGIRSVPREWEVDQPERYQNAVSEIHAAASKVAKVHEEFVALARRRLNL